MTHGEQGRALLQAILDEPDDDAVRLIYADWLEEGGQGERAEFVRVQVELANWKCLCRNADGTWNGACGFCDSNEKRRRERELLRSHGDDWLGIMKRADEVVTHHVGPNHNTPN